jgi:hypothetical protein
MNQKWVFVSICLAVLGLSACTTYRYEPSADSAKFYEDKLSCETKYSPGYDMFGNRTFGDVYKEGPSRDCMLAKGYKSQP